LAAPVGGLSAGWVAEALGAAAGRGLEQALHADDDDVTAATGCCPEMAT